MRWMLLAAVGLVGCSGGCRDQGAGPGPDAQVRDGALGPEAQVAEADVDVWQPPSEGPPAVLRHWCDKPLVRFPYEWRLGGFVQPGGGWLYVGWGYRRDMSNLHMRLLNLDTCVEYALVPEWWQVCDFTTYVGLSHERFVVSGEKCPENGSASDLFVVDLATWEVSAFRPSPDLWEDGLDVNDRYVVYKTRYIPDNPSQIREYVFIADLETGEATELLEQGWSVHFSISDRYLVWSNNDNIYYLNLETWEQERIEEPVPRAQVLPKTDGDLAVWMETDDPEAGPFDMVVYHLDTGEREVVAEDVALPGVLPFVQLSRDLVLYSTGENVTQEDLERGPVWDLVLYDVRTGVRRRLTSAPMYIGPADGAFHAPWLPFDILDHEGRLECGGMYLANLERLGVVDSQGRLLEGGPVFEPPCP